MPIKHYRYVILGAGPTGLGAAYRLKELGEKDFIILEKSDKPGGLSRSFVDEKGFTWDIGGHVRFSHYPYYDLALEKALSEENWFHHTREAWAWLRESFIPYPVQNHIGSLPKDVMWKCLEGLIDLSQKNSAPKPTNFHEWILKSFGQGLADEFIVPYNYKVWGYHPSKLSCQWIGERVATVDLKKIIKQILLNENDFKWGPNDTFVFPKLGGTGAVWQAVANFIGNEFLKLNQEVVEINSSQKKILLATGEEISYELLLSTIPLDILCQKTLGLNADIGKLAQNLKHSSSNIVGIGLKGSAPDHLRKKSWIYFSENNCPFYRATIFSNYSPYNVPDPSQHWSIMTETSESPDKKANRSTLIEDTISGLLNTHLITSRSNIVSKWIYSADYGYPTPSLERDTILNKVIPALEELGIFSRGRFGAWKYEISNQDHSFMQGVEWVNRRKLSIPEFTV